MISRKVWRRLTLITAVIIIGLYAAGTALLYYNQDRMVFPAGGPHYDDCQDIMKLGGMPVQEWHEEKQARYILLEGEKPQAWVIVFHGNGGSVCYRTYHAKNLKKPYLNIVMAEYPGYGGDGSKPSDELFFENALTVYDVIRKKAGAQPLFLMGKSLGSAVATYAAANRKTAGLILHTPYTSVENISQSRFPLVPIGLLLKHKFEADKWAPKVESPVLALHGTADRIVPYKFGQEQAKNFPSPPRFVTFEGANHNNLGHFDAGRYWDEIHEFIRSKL